MGATGPAGTSDLSGTNIYPVGGSVGIGNPAPAAALDVSGSVIVNGGAIGIGVTYGRLSIQSQNKLLISGGAVSIGDDDPYRCTINENTLQTTYFTGSVVYNTALYLNPYGGNVGVGKSSANVALDVSGAITSSGTITGGAITGSSLTTTAGATISGDLNAMTDVYIGTSPNRTRITTDGTASWIQNYSNGNKVIISAPAATNPTLITDVGNQRVGIVTTAPTATLDVSGNAKISGDLTVTGNIIFNVQSI
jgi:hypothetical protein